MQLQTCRIDDSGQLVLRDYSIAGLTECRLLNHGLNDTYLVKANNSERYILRVYRAGWRSSSDISYELRELKEADIESIPLFIGVRHIWVMGLRATNAYDWGYGGLNDDYYDHQIKFLHKWESEYFMEKGTG
jgi:Ser/Thr protein kinase RdoA (MazF antagonist)